MDVLALGILAGDVSHWVVLGACWVVCRNLLGCMAGHRGSYQHSARSKRKKKNVFWAHIFQHETCWPQPGLTVPDRVLFGPTGPRGPVPFGNKPRQRIYATPSYYMKSDIVLGSIWDQFQMPYSAGRCRRTGDLLSMPAATFSKMAGSDAQISKIWALVF